MKKVFLLIAVLALSCTVAFAQQPDKKKQQKKDKTEQTKPDATANPNCGNCPNHQKHNGVNNGQNCTPRNNGTDATNDKNAQQTASDKKDTPKKGKKK